MSSDIVEIFVPAQYDVPIYKLNKSLTSLGIKYKLIDEMFIHGDSSYLVIGKPESGKTTLCYNVINKYCKDDNIRIYYLSSRDEIVNQLNKVPYVFAKKLTYDNLYYIWKLIKKNETPEGTNAKSVLLIEDVDLTMKELSKSNSQVEIENDNDKMTISISKAFNDLLNDICTKSRRYNTVNVITCSYWSIIDFKNSMKNFIIMDSETADSLRLLKTFGTAELRNAVLSISKELKEYPYNPLVIMNNEVFITKPRNKF